MALARTIRREDAEGDPRAICQEDIERTGSVPNYLMEMLAAASID